MKRKRRTFSAETKAKIALEAMKGEKTVNEIAQLYEAHPNQVSQWKGEMLANASAAFDKGKRASVDELGFLGVESLAIDETSPNKGLHAHRRAWHRIWRNLSVRQRLVGSLTGGEFLRGGTAKRRYLV